MVDYTNNGSECMPNTSIQCSVNSCAHHCQGAEYCGLNAIRVGTHESDPTVEQCTDCQNFRRM